MPLKTILFIGLFALCTFGALGVPLLGVLGYVGHYCVGPERQWWEAPISGYGIRYSFWLAAATAIGIAIGFRSLRYGKSFLVRQEWLLVLFVAMVWLSSVIGEETKAYTIVDHPTVKMTKVILFTLMLTHVVTTVRDLNRLIWVLIVGALVLGLQAYTVPRSSFMGGRLESVGGPDFAEANFLPVFLGSILPLAGIQFLRSRWPGKLLCLASGVFATNAIVLTRSRGAVVGIAVGGVAALLLAPRKHRRIIAIGLVVAALGAFYLMDPAFISRASTITRSEDERDFSAQSRLVIWGASWRMLKDHPFGVGAGNFFQAIGHYLPEPADPQASGAGRLAQADAHNTFVRCYSELGVQGLAVLLLLIGHAVWTCRRLMRRAETLPDDQRESLVFLSYAVTISLITFIFCSLTVTMLYVEALWWLLALPVCLQRALDNALEDAEPRLLAAT